MPIRYAFVVFAAAASVSTAIAQTALSPYTNLGSREIKALSLEQIRDLREGRGMGLSMPAERNGAPGPLHVLELRLALGISGAQVVELEQVTDTMRTRAKSLGEEIIRAEAALDALFKVGSPDEAQIASLTERIGLLNGQLRATHLVAHLWTKRLLTPSQIASYEQVRGYGQAGVQPKPESSGESGNGAHHRH